MSTQAGILDFTNAPRTQNEEFVLALTHGIGLVMSLAAGIVLVTDVAQRGDLASVLGCSFYIFTLVLVYAASTLSHMQLPARLNRAFRSLDQGAIYLLIVGTLTPFAVKYMMVTSFWTCFYMLLLAVACCGFLSKTVLAHRVDTGSVWLYVALGWTEAVAFKPLLGVIPQSCLLWIVAGGLCYTVGVAFLVLDIRRYHFHAIWHVLVILGSACHYLAIREVVGLG